MIDTASFAVDEAHPELDRGAIHGSDKSGDDCDERATDQDQHEWSGKTKRRAEPGRLLPFMGTNPSNGR